MGHPLCYIVAEASCLYSALNSDAIPTQLNAYGAAWTRPTSVIHPRFVKFSGRWDF